MKLLLKTIIFIGSITATSFGFLRTPPAAAVSLTFRTFQHNVHFTFTGAINSASQSTSGKPLVITAQELCRNPYENIKTNLMSRGYTVWGYAQANTSHAPTACDGTDGAIVMVATTGSVTLLTRGPFAQQAGPVKYGYVCVQGGAFLYSWNACAGHTHCCNISVSVGNADNLRAIAHLLNDRPIMVGADMQRTPTQSGPTSWYSSFNEVDENGPLPGRPGGYRGAYTFKRRDGGIWHTPTKKIDYFFSGKIRMTAGYGVAVVPYDTVSTYSDHNYVWGTNQM